MKLRAVEENGKYTLQERIHLSWKYIEPMDNSKMWAEPDGFIRTRKTPWWVSTLEEVGEWANKFREVRGGSKRTYYRI